MTTTARLEKSSWKQYFDQVSRPLAGTKVEIEVASLDVGVQLAAKWIPLLGLSYDESDDIIAVMAEGLNHLIRQPSSVFIESDGLNLISMEVMDASGSTQIVRFKEPLLLPRSAQ